MAFASSKKELGIYDLVKGVRSELLRIANDEEIQKEPLLFLKNLELEIKVVITKAGKAGVNFYVVTAGADYNKEQTSTIRLSFAPLAGSEGKRIPLKSDLSRPRGRMRPAHRIVPMMKRAKRK